MFITTANRLVMRYSEGPSFSFRNVRFNATDENVFDLAQAFASLQTDPANEPRQIVRVITQNLEI